MPDKLQALMDAAHTVVKLYGRTERLGIYGLEGALESLRSALASGEVVVTTFADYSEDCGDHPMTFDDVVVRDECGASGIASDCARSNCPRLPKVTE